MTKALRSRGNRFQHAIQRQISQRIDAEVRGDVDQATEKCKAAGPPPLEILTTDVYADGGWAWRN